MKLKPYPKYKPSDIEWLGDVPEHWEVKPLKRVASFLEGPGIMAADFSDEGIPLLRISCISASRVSLNGCNFVAAHLADSKWKHFMVRQHDLLISGSASTGFWSEVDEKSVGAIPYTGIIIIRPIQREAKLDFARCFPLPEQAAIAAYLDMETAKLGALVGKVESAIERLQEYRTALITAAVTGKIDVREPSTKHKKSTK